MRLLIISFTLNPYLKKQASHNVSSSEFTLIYQILAILFIVCYVGYLVQSKTCSLSCFKKMTNNEISEVFNCGFGFTIIVDKKASKQFLKRKNFKLLGSIK